MANKHDVQLRTQLLEKLFPTVETVDNLDSDNVNRPLSARQGKVLKELIKSGGGGSGLSIEVVETLPSTGSVGILYLVPKTSYLKEENTYDEYVWIESSNKYEMLGSFSTDLNIEEYVDKFNSVLGEVGEINVATLSDYGINSYVTTGTYRVYGERINNTDGLPILNAANGHTVEGILKIYNSSISGTGANTDKVVTQVLTMSNRTGGDGHIWIRTGQGSREDNLTWSTWEKLQGIFEKNTITDISEINTFTTNGIYSCMYHGSNAIIDGFSIYDGDTLLIIVVNGYMASNLGLKPHLTQSIILTRTGTSSFKSTNYIFTRSAVFYDNDNVWHFDDRNNIILGSFIGNGANIGFAIDKDKPINIGTFNNGKKLNISRNVFIGNTYTDDDVVYDVDSTIISPGVRIANNVYIGTNPSNVSDDTIHISNGVKMFNDEYFNISNTIKKSSLKIGSNTNVIIKSNYITVGSIQIKEVNIEAGVNIKSNVTIGTNTVIGRNTNIGNYVTIGNYTTIANNVNIDYGFTVSGEVKISHDLNNSNQTHSYGFKNFTNAGQLYLSIDSNLGIGTIAFKENGIEFYLGDKKATLPFNV